MKVALAMIAMATLLAGAPAAMAQTATAAAPEMTDAEVRKVDPATNKITLRHGEIRNLDMPRMTMVFHVKDPAMLASVKPGDKVRFIAEKINGAYTVTSIVPAP